MREIPGIHLFLDIVKTLLALFVGHRRLVRLVGRLFEALESDPGVELGPERVQHFLFGPFPVKRRIVVRLSRDRSVRVLGPSGPF